MYNHEAKTEYRYNSLDLIQVKIKNFFFTFKHLGDDWGWFPVSDVVVHVVLGQVENILGQHLRLPGIGEAQLGSQVQHLLHK